MAKAVVLSAQERLGVNPPRREQPGNIWYYVGPVKKQLIGFIGQGFIGKHMADDFEKRGYDVVRYALEEPYVANREKIAECDITFIAVPFSNHS